MKYISNWQFEFFLSKPNFYFKIQLLDGFIKLLIWQQFVIIRKISIKAGKKSFNTKLKA